MIDRTLVWMGRIAVADGHLDNTEKRIIREYGEITGSDSSEIEDFIKSLELEARLHRRVVQPLRPEELKGMKFENLAFRIITRSKDIDVESRAADYKLAPHNGPLDQRSREPDLFVRVRFGIFHMGCWIECKYRSRGKLGIRMQKIRDYIRAGNRLACPVFIMFGAGGIPEKPDDIFLIPIGDIVSGMAAYFREEKFNICAESLQNYRMDPNAITENLKKYLRL